MTKHTGVSDSDYYLVQVSAKVVLDDQDSSHVSGRYINDGKRAGRRVNTTFGAATHPVTCNQTGHKYISVRDTLRIKTGEEILVSYGPDYWAGDVKRQPKAGKPAVMGVPDNVSGVRLDGCRLRRQEATPYDGLYISNVHKGTT